MRPPSQIGGCCAARGRRANCGERGAAAVQETAVATAAAPAAIAWRRVSFITPPMVALPMLGWHKCCQRLLFGCSWRTAPRVRSDDALAEDGSRFVASIPPSGDAACALRRAIVEGSHRPTLSAAASELRRGLTGLFGREPGDQLRGGAIVLGTPASSHLVASLHLALKSAGDEGYCLKSIKSKAIR